MYAIFYKEWIKTRWYFLLAVLATLGFTGYSMLRINRVVEMKGAAHVWEVMLQRDVIFIDMLQNIPLIAGISGYLLVAWICLEPAWKRRILNLVIAVLLLRIFFLSPTPEAYNKFLPYLLVYTLLTASFSWLSIVRFKAGKQD